MSLFDVWREYEEAVNKMWNIRDNVLITFYVGIVEYTDNSEYDT